jgi:hypothetical protein
MTPKTKFLMSLLLCICAIMCYAGLKPKGLRLHNRVSWLGNENGIRFEKFGITFSSPSKIPKALFIDSLSIELILKIPKPATANVPIIFSLWSEKSPESFQLGQWKNHLIFEKRAVYFFRDKLLDFGTGIELNKVIVIMMTSCRSQGTKVFINGKKVQSSKTFSIGNTGEFYNRLVLGNSPTGQCPWQGEVYGLSIYNQIFNEPDVQARFQQWSQSPIKLPLSSLNAIALYSFDEHKGAIIHDCAGKMGDLFIPKIFQIPHKIILSMPWKDLKFDKASVEDTIINIFGFMPFGFILFALLSNMGGFSRRHRMAITIISGALFSLFFELIQVFIPTRYSQLSDLLLNVFGTFLGALLLQWFLRRNSIYGRILPNIFSLKKNKVYVDK